MRLYTDTLELSFELFCHYTNMWSNSLTVIHLKQYGTTTGCTHTLRQVLDFLDSFFFVWLISRKHILGLSSLGLCWSARWNSCSCNCSHCNARKVSWLKIWTPQNVLAAITFDLKFTYVLAGWEGSAHDSHVLNDALTRSGGFKIPGGIIRLKSVFYCQLIVVTSNFYFIVTL